MTREVISRSQRKNKAKTDTAEQLKTAGTPNIEIIPSVMPVKTESEHKPESMLNKKKQLAEARKKKALEYYYKNKDKILEQIHAKRNAARKAKLEKKLKESEKTEAQNDNKKIEAIKNEDKKE
jgi:RecA-family ATPase